MVRCSKNRIARRAAVREKISIEGDSLIDMAPSQTVAYSTGPAISHSIKISAERQYFTDLAWTLPDWSSLLGTTYAREVRSELFRIDGIDDCTCQISIDPYDSTKSLAVKFSDAVDVLAVKMIIHLNSYRFERLEMYPVSRIICLPGSVQCENNNYDIYHGRRNSTLNTVLTGGVLNSSALIKVRFEVAKFPAIHSFFYQKPQKTVVENLKDMFDGKTFCDVTFVFENIELPAHKGILAVQSKVFEAMFTNEMSEKDTGRVEVLDIRAEVFEAFLKYLYIKEIDELKNNVEEMLVVADKYEVCDLKNLCEKYMLTKLCEQNLVRYLLIADKLSCTALKKESLTMLQSNAVVLCRVIQNENVETFMSLKEIFSNDSSKRSKNQ